MQTEVLRQIQRRRRLFATMKRRRPPRRRRLPRQAQPTSISLAYFRALMTLLERARAMVRARLLPILPRLAEEAARVRADAKRQDDVTEINRLLDEMSGQFYRALLSENLQALGEQFAERTSEFQREELKKQLRVAIGVDVPINDLYLGPRIKAFTAENVALIKSIPQRYFDQVETSVIRGLREGKRAGALAEDLEERFEVAESSAQLIARDQIGKFYGELNHARQVQLGVAAYFWRTSNDNRVRPEHAERENKRYTWTDPPEDGHPGQAVNCRCFAEPDLLELIESL